MRLIALVLCLLAWASTPGAAQLATLDAGGTSVVYFFDASGGSDSNNCLSPATACANISHLNSLTIPAKAFVLFKGGQTFSGGIVLTTSVTPGPIIVSTYGSGSPTISSTTSACLTATNIPNVTVSGLICTGSGNTVNATPGISIINNQAGNTHLFGPVVTFNTVSGYGFNGIEVLGNNSTSGFNGITVSGNTVHDVTGNSGTTPSQACIKVGIGTSGTNSSSVHANGTVTGNTAYNCTGTSTASSNWTGSGTFVADITSALVDRNVAHDFGVNNTSTSGPVGIWTAYSSGVTIQRSEAYNGKSAGGDGDGFDCDGSTTNCLLQYNFSHENVGAGLMVCAFTAAAVSNPTVRFNIAQNNGKPGALGQINVCGGAAITGLAIYNNSLYASSVNTGPGMTESGGTAPSGHVANNIVYGGVGKTLVNWADTASISLTGNDYFGSADFTWAGTSYTTYAAWQTASSQEKIGGVNVGLTSNPSLYVPGGGFIGAGSGYDPAFLMAYNLQSGSPMIGAGLDLNAQFGINPGTQDFYGNAIAMIGGSYPVGAATGDFPTFAASCTASSNFLARVSSFSKLAQVNYNSLLCGMNSDGDFAKLDAFYLLGAPNSASAILNLVSTSFTLTAHGTLTFTANAGYAGDGSTGYFDTGFNPSTAGGNFALNSGLLGDYDLTSRTTGATSMDAIGAQDASSYTNVVPYLGGCSGEFGSLNENANTGPGLCGSSGNAQGSQEMVRTGSGTEAIYYNGTQEAPGTTASNTLPNGNFYVLARDISGSPSKFNSDQLMAVWFGGGPSPVNLARRVNSFATALGINVY